MIRCREFRAFYSAGEDGLSRRKYSEREGEEKKKKGGEMGRERETWRERRSGMGGENEKINGDR